MHRHLAQADGISACLLAVRLRLLEKHKPVAREAIASHPVQIRYTLPQSGNERVRVLVPLVPWACRWGIAAA
ncbi:winged helix-turn-helix transcriptional regulator [Streptomyces shenzhenensis]|uniref:winged helix-turn-helix transcriptional regulator n=1 Tax=Streptomyces shenzhenensis TaxID=943815 RepID=UPI001604BDB7